LPVLEATSSVGSIGINSQESQALGSFEGSVVAD
jgi:hypothetical protein